MESPFKRIARNLYISQKKLLVKLGILFVKSIRPNLILAYDASTVRDGVGAQIHRILSLSLVSYLFNLRMTRPRIEDITIHPLDPIQDPNSLRSHLADWNGHLFSSKQYTDPTGEVNSDSNEYFSSLKLRNLIILSIKAKLSKSSITIHTREAHSISDYCVEEYRVAISHYFNEFLQFLELQKRNFEIIVHYRQGSGAFAIHPGQSIPRQVSIDSVICAIENISSLSMKKIKAMRLFTDSPKEPFVYSPIQSQLYLWKDMPGFDGKSVTNQSSGVEKCLLPIAEHKNLSFVVDREIDAFQMIVAMAKSEVLVMSRSSLSYVGALFNPDGEVFYPNNFWHTKLKKWHTYK